MSSRVQAASSGPDFAGYFARLREAVRERLAGEWAEHREALFEIGEAYVHRARGDLQRWTGLLAVGALTQADFEWLVKGRKELAEMEALRNAGLTLAQADRLRAALVETVVGTALKHFLPF